jgi:hypothetical protein
MSWQFRVAFWAITAPIIPFVVLLVILVVMNPFWFREDFAGLVELKINQFSKWRFEKLKPLYYKDNFFNILKNPEDFK